MTFSSITRKNFMYNLRKYLSFYFVNSIIVGMLLMYGSLMYNPNVLDEIGKSTLYETINMSLLGIGMFSIVFITYTNIAFLKHRGKEFGMYLTLGMTTKDLSKLIFVENLGIMVLSLITGFCGGALFSRLFYMGLNKVMAVTPINYFLSYKSFLFSGGVFILIFLCNFIFNIIYIRRFSIIDVIKSSKKKEVGKQGIFLGVVAIILFAVSVYCLPKTLLKQILADKQYFIGIFIGTIIISLYMIIGTIMGVIKFVFQKIPKVYNGNILVLSNLSHRFLAYKNILYSLSILIAGAIFYVGFTYSMYVSTRDYIELDNNYEIMFVESSKFNKVEKEEIESILEKYEENIKSYNEVEYIEIPQYRVESGQVSLWSDESSIISQSEYNKHMTSKYNLNDNEAVYVDSYGELMEHIQPTTILPIIDEEIKSNLREALYDEKTGAFLENITEERFHGILGDSNFLKFEKENIKSEKESFTNVRMTNQYRVGATFIVNDKLYNEIKEVISGDSIKYMHLIDMNDISDDVFYGILNHLRAKNNLDESYWQNGSLFGTTSHDKRGDIEAYRPVHTEELVELQLESNGIGFFSMVFIGIMFFIANGVVLYYKVLSDIDDEKERVNALTRIGITETELKSIISKELAITFFVPMIIGGGIGIYFLYIMMSNNSIAGLLMKRSLAIFIICIIAQTIFYCIGKRKYINDVI